jgi:chromosomal replication initiator protein
MNSAVLDQVFSVPYRHLYSTDFAGDLTSMIGAPNGLNRFVGDRSNFMLKCFSERDSRANFLDDHCPWPVVLYGPTGTGKTALAMAILAQLGESSRASDFSSSVPFSDDHRFSNRNAGETSKPIFLSAQDFDRRYRLALETESLDEFRLRISRSAGLAIDNLHQLDQKNAVQRELISLLSLYPHLPFVFTMNSAPTVDRGFCPQLASRLAAGLVLAVEPPGPAARADIVGELATLNKLNLADDAVELIVNRFDVTVPKIVHLLAQVANRLKSVDDFEPGSVVDADLLNRLLQKDSADIDQIANLVLKKSAAKFHLKMSDLKSNSRKQSVVLARCAAVYLIRELTHCSFKQIGRYCGNRDHSTILHSYRKICAIMKSPESSDDVSLKNNLLKLKHQLSDSIASQANLF